MPIGVPCNAVDILEMPPERVEASSGVQSPKLDGAIIAPTGQKSSSRAKGDALDIALMSLEVPDDGFASHIPDFDRAVRAPTGKHAAIQAEGDASHRIGMMRDHRIARMAFL